MSKHLSQPLRTVNKQFNIGVTFLPCYKGLINVTNKINKFHFIVSINDDDFCQIIIEPRAYKLESLNDKIKRINIKEVYFTEQSNTFLIKPNFTTFGSIIKFKSNFIGTQINFVHDDSLRDLLVFNEEVIYEKYNKSGHPVAIISFDNIFIETNNARGMIFRGKTSGIIFNFSLDVNPGFGKFHKLRGGVQWNMIESKGSISSINLKFQNEIKEMVSFNGQSVTSRLSIKET